MNTKAFNTTIRGDTEGAGTPAIGAPGAFYAVDFPALKPKDLKPGPLPPATADRSVGRGLTKSEEEETISINRSGRSTYLEEKSVQTSGATPGRTIITWGSAPTSDNPLDWGRPMAYPTPMEFEWDQAKSEACFIERGFDFAYVLRAFRDTDRLIHKDTRWDYGEDRYQLLGAIDGRVFFVAYTLRGTVLRIISARKANRREVHDYEKSKRKT